MTNIDDLSRLCPPPADPPAVDWPAVESALGRKLPTDYKQLATVYGPGSFCRFLHIHHPLSGLTKTAVTTLQEQLQCDRDQPLLSVPYTPQHLVVVGVTDNGDHLFWITDPEAEPDHWRITVKDRDSREWFTFQGTLIEFLVSVLSGETSVPQFPEDLLQGTREFTPSPRTTATPPRPAPPLPDTNVIREWAWANGYDDLPPRGRVPAAIIDAWKDAHTDAEH